MKKIILLLSVVFLLNACSLNDDDGTRFHYELLPVESVDIPDSFEIGETYPITIRYYAPTTCHAFDGFYYEKDLNIRTIAVRNVVFEQNNCIELTNSLIEKTLNFYVTSNGSYIFKFWQGTDDAGEDVFLEYEIPVN